MSSNGGSGKESMHRIGKERFAIRFHIQLSYTWNNQNCVKKNVCISYYGLEVWEMTKKNAGR